MRVSGSVGTFCSKITLPASSTTHADVSFTDTSRPTECAISSLLPSMPEVEPTSIHSSSQKGLHTQHPRLSRSRRDTPSFGDPSLPRVPAKVASPSDLSTFVIVQTDSDETLVSPRTSKTLPKPWPLRYPRLQPACPQAPGQDVGREFNGAGKHDGLGDTDAHRARVGRRARPVA